MSTFRTLQDQERAIQAAALENARKLCIINVYLMHEDFVRCAANDKAIIDVIERYIGRDVVPTSSLFQDALALNEDEIQNFARTTLSVAKEQVVSEYITLLNAHSRQSEHTLKLERQKLLNTPLQECRDKLAALKLRQKMSAMPVAELNKIVQDARPDQGYPTLPREQWSSSEGRFVALDAAYLKTAHPIELKRLLRIYGDQVNARLQGR